MFKIRALCDWPLYGLRSLREQGPYTHQKQCELEEGWVAESSVCERILDDDKRVAVVDE